MSYLAIQSIEIHYTDDQRGAVDAAKRERIRGIPLVAIAGDGVFQEVRVYGWEGFEPRTSVSGLPWRDGVVRVREALELRVETGRLVFWSEAGAEPWTSKTILAVEQGDWGRVIWNERRITHEERWLVELVVNAGSGRGTRSPA